MNNTSQTSNQNGPKMNMPRFNMNWIYGIVIITLMALYISSGGSDNSSIQTKASYQQFKTMVAKGYASKIVVNNDQKLISMYVKPEHIRDVFKQGVQQTGREPSVAIEYGSVDQVEQFVEQARLEKKFTGDFSYENKTDSSFFNFNIVSSLCNKFFNFFSNLHNLVNA